MHSLIRRRPDLIVAALFLWAPAILTVALAIDDPDIIFAALVVSMLPYLGVLGWCLVTVLREASPLKRWIILGVLAVLVALLSGINWGPPLEY